MTSMLGKLLVGSMAAGSVFGLAVPAAAAEPNWVEAVTFPAGIACTFPLRIDTAGGANRHDHVVLDKAGDLIVAHSTGTGDNLRYTNVDTGSWITTKSNGAVFRTTKNDDGATVLIGHNVLIMFPTDDPAGPSTTVYSGQVTITTDATGKTVILKETGTGLDVCAAVAGNG